MRLRLETLANTAIIVLSVTVAAVLAKNYLLAPVSPGPLGIRKGQTFELPQEANFTTAESTLVVALSPGCSFCTQSLPFYRSLVTRRDSGKAPLRIVAVVARKGQIEDEQRILEEAGIHVDALLPADLAELGISGTPTLILVDRRGEVMEVWPGKLSEEREIRVLQSLGLT